MVLETRINLLAIFTVEGMYSFSDSVFFYVWNRLVVVMNSCTDKNIYVLNGMENVLFTCNRVLQFFAMCGKTSIVIFL